MVKARKDMTGWVMAEHGVPDSRLVVIEYCGNGKWLCECQCDSHNRHIVDGRHLRNGHTKSCGCLQKEAISQTNKLNHKANRYDLSGEYGIGWTHNTNQEFYFDLDDYDKIKNFCWTERIQSTGYRELCARNMQTNKLIRMHKLLVNYDIVDHINRNTLDNRKSNLRSASFQQNASNSTIHKNNTSGVTGVNWKESLCKWCARISYNNKDIHLGYYIDKNEAIKNRLKAEVKYFGEFAPQRHLFSQYGITEVFNEQQ